MGIIKSLFKGWGTDNKSGWSWTSSNKGKSYVYNEINSEEPIQAFKGNDAVYSIVHKIALNGSNLPYKVMKGDNEVFDKYFELMEQPNEEQARNEFMYRCFTNFSLTGDLFILKKQRSIGFGVTDLITLPSQNAEVIRETEGDILSPIKHYTFELGGVQKIYEPEEIIHLKYYDPSIEGQETENGLSPLQAGQYILEANNNLTVAESVLLNNRGANNLISGGDSTYPLTGKEKDALDTALGSRIGGAKKFNKTITVGSEIKIHKLDMSPSDLKLIESYPNQLRRLCTIFSMPAELFNAEGSGQFNTRKEALRSSYTEAIIPIAELIYSAIDRGLNQGYKQIVDKSKIDALNPSRDEKNMTYLDMFKNGAISRETFLELTEIEDNGKTFRTITNGQGRNQES